MLKWLFGSKRKPSGPLLTLTFYMRSGNAITINGVTEYTIDSGDHGPKRIELKQWLDKGLTERQVLYGHVFRNAMLIVISGFPAAFVHAFFTGSLLIESIFSLDGLGLLSYESIINRDYPVVFANLYIFALLGLIVNLISDLTYTWIDPRIDFETREV